MKSPPNDAKSPAAAPEGEAEIEALCWSLLAMSIEVDGRMQPNQRAHQAAALIRSQAAEIETLRNQKRRAALDELAMTAQEQGFYYQGRIDAGLSTPLIEAQTALKEEREEHIDTMQRLKDAWAERDQLRARCREFEIRACVLRRAVDEFHCEAEKLTELRKFYVDQEQIELDADGGGR